MTRDPSDAVEALFKGLMESAPDAVVISSADGVIRFANRRADELFGYERDELPGRPVEILVPERFRAAHVRHRTDYYAEPRTRPMGRAGLELWARRKDGSEFPAEISLSPLDTGETLLVTTIVRDVSERRQAEAERTRLLRHAEAAEIQLRAILDAAPDAIIMTDHEGRILLANDQAGRWFGYRPDELIGQPIEVLVPDRFRERHVAERRSYVARPRTRPMGAGLALAARRRDGTEFPVEISLSPVQSDGATYIIAIARDVTVQREFQRQREEFFANASHDLRTPLSAIKTSIGVVLDHEPIGTPEPIHRLLLNISRSADRMDHLVSDLLELARLEAGHGELHRDECDLRALAAQAATAIEPLAEARSQRVVVNLPPEPVIASVDAKRLERVLLNLLGNAHKYGREGGTIGLRLERHPGEVRLAVSDDGPGIPEADQPRIFDRFYRLPGATSQRHAGSGLGLPIVRALIELHGGRVRVESVPGQGSTFRIALPVSNPRADDQEACSPD